MTLSFAPERIETWPLSRLQPYAKNAKVHGAEQVAKIKRIVEDLSMEVATPDEARQILGTKGGDQVKF